MAMLAIRKKLRRWSKKVAYSDRIIMTGYVKDISSIYSVMDVCVHTSIEPEPFGLVIIEAMVNGVPVIASDAGAPGEIIDDKVNGYIVDPKRSGELAETIISLLNDAELRGNIGQKGRLHVKKNYNVKDYARSVEQVYRVVLGKSI